MSTEAKPKPKSKRKAPSCAAAEGKPKKARGGAANKATEKEPKRKRNGTVSGSEDDARELLRAFTVALTGIPVTTPITLRGVHSATHGAVVTFAGAKILPQRATVETVKAYPELWAQFLGKLGSIAFYEGMTSAERATAITKDLADNDRDLQQAGETTMVVHSVGSSKMTKIPADALSSLLQATTPTPTKEIKMLIPPLKPDTKAARPTLVFLLKFWRISEADAVLTLFDDGPMWSIERSAFVTGEQEAVFLVDDVPYNNEIVTMGLVAKHSSTAWSRAALVDLISEVTEVEKTQVDDVWSQVFTASVKFTPAFFKSALQKLIRFRPASVVFDTSATAPGPKAELVLLCVVAQLLLHPGCFVPNLQRFVSGVESAFKRVFVSLCEDASFDPDDDRGWSLADYAVLAQRHRSWRPHISAVLLLFRCALVGIRSTRCFQYSTEKKDERAQSSNMRASMAAAFLRSTGSFEGDMEMVDNIVEISSQLLPERKCPVDSVMPWHHIVDQHSAADVVYFMEDWLLEKYPGRKRSTPFGPLLRECVFRMVTGLNPRKHDLSKATKTAEFEAVAKAQALYLAFLQQPQERAQRAVVSGSQYVLPCNVDVGWLAAGVGALRPKKITPKALVTLDDTRLLKLRACKDPSRSMKTHVLEPAVAAKAEAAAKSMLVKGVPWSGCTPPVPEWIHSIILLKERRVPEHAGGDDDADELETSLGDVVTAVASVLPPEIAGLVGWMLDTSPFYYALRLENGLEVPWEEARTRVCRLPIHQPIDDDETKTWVGAGVEAGGEAALVRYLKSIKQPSTLARSLIYLRGFEHAIRMPKVSVSGEGTREPVTVEDVAVFRLFRKISRWFPGALRHTEPTVFEIALAPLLWHVRDLISQTLDSTTLSDQINVGWPAIADSKRRRRWAHQQDALQHMRAKKRHGHFLWIPVGLGKTSIVLEYLAFASSKFRYVVYALPRSAMASVKGELELYGCPYIVFDPKKKKQCNVRHEFKVLLIEHDQLRDAVDEIAHLGPQMLFVCDEAHKTMHDTQRTDAAIYIAACSKEFIAMSGTAVIDSKTYKLTRWLRFIVPYEVTTSNFYVAAASMISQDVATGVRVLKTRVVAEFSPAERQSYQSLAPPGLGGKNVHCGGKAIHAAMLVCNAACMRKVVELVVDLVLVQKKRGVFVVVETAAELEATKAQLINNNIPSKWIECISRSQSLDLRADNLHVMPDCKVALTTTSHSTGYNLTRFDVDVARVMPGNEATWQQLDGRLNRIGQRSAVVEHIRVVDSGGFWASVDSRHTRCSNVNGVLKLLIN